MRISSTNIAEPKTINWKGKEVTTGIFKYAVDEGIFLGNEDVDNDHVIDRRYHGGADKACYLYSADHYLYWQEQYPNIKMPWGMFGENLTVEGLNETETNIGNIYKIGKSLVQVTHPRQPCFKIEFRIPDPQIVKRFIQSGFPGVYVRVLEKGIVKTGDQMELIKREEGLSIQKVFELLYATKFNPLVKEAVNNPFIAKSCKHDLLKRWGEFL